MQTPHNLQVLAIVGAAVVVAGTVALLVARRRPKPAKKGKTVLFPARDAYDGPSYITIPPNASVLPKEVLVDKIKGVIYGQAIGDAIGLATEFMKRQECVEYYGKYKYISYKAFHNDFHRSRWTPGDWTDDTDQMILILEGMLSTGGQVDAVDFAKRLKFWVKKGFPELGDVAGCGLGATVHTVVSNPRFETDPHACAVRAWENSMKNNAANGAVMRTSILGIPHFEDLGVVIANTQNICKTTHADPRCVASCVFVTSLIAMMLKGEPCTDELIEKAYFMGNMELSSEKEKQEFYQYCHAKSLKDLQLDFENSIGYTLKCLGSGVFCVRGTDFKTLINDLVMEGGDSDTNAAVAGALLGCKIGYSKLPQDWLSGLKEKEWLDEKVDRFLALLGLA
eukprot:Phypoly_transcript_02893.p1 GENE.Phypoly_transcript_02893~~Phypoly_transcript_02893.p1  ORF type:complete len:395 (+),score=66.58 Phypoly_transcript_02893:1362-2546(+)